jgi:hypothetical protein
VSDDGRPDALRRFFAALLMTIGALIAGLSGLCSAVFLVGYASSGPDRQMIVLPLFFGAPPILFGVGLFLLGRRLWRRDQRPPD